jgi:hypothetical protein
VTRKTGTLCEDLRTFMILSCSFLLRMRDVSNKSCREKTHFFSINFFLKYFHCHRWQYTMDVHMACWINKTMDKRSECNIYCFSTATVVMQKHFNVMFIRIVPLLIFLSEEINNIKNTFSYH